MWWDTHMIVWNGNSLLKKEVEDSDALARTRGPEVHA